MGPEQLAAAQQAHQQAISEMARQLQFIPAAAKKSGKATGQAKKASHTKGQHKNS